MDENATGNANKYGIRNSSYADIANAYNVGGIKGVGNSLSSFITSKDLDNIKEFNRLVSEEGVSSQTAWYKTMQTSSSAAKELFDNEENLIKSGNSVILSEEAMSNATNTMTFWKIVKYMEAKLLGNDLPYDTNELNSKRQKVRDRINELKVLIVNLEI